MDAIYLKKTVGGYLAEGLAEVASKRPSDPIEYLGLWLLKQKQNLVNKESIQSFVSSVPPSSSITLTETEESPKEPEAIQTTEIEPKEVVSTEEQEVVPVVTAEIDKPPSTLDIIQEEPDEPQSSGAPNEVATNEVKEENPLKETTAEEEVPTSTSDDVALPKEPVPEDKKESKEPLTEDQEESEEPIPEDKEESKEPVPEDKEESKEPVADNDTNLEDTA